MAVRLSVIMVHSPPPTAATAATAERMVESVVGELIGLSGIDLTLVGPIALLAETSTDRLTLDSLSGDVAVLDWQPPAESVADLASIGFEGQRSPHEHDPDVPPPAANSRRVYAFDLNQFSGAGDVVAVLSKLKSSRQVRTFSLELAPPASKPAAKPAAKPADRPPLASDRASPASSAEPGETLNLDDLLDQLDQLDP